MFTPTYVDVDETLLHVETAGPADGTPAVFLHGWPDLWTSFLPQLTALADQGYRVIAPDQRGYGLSGKPPAVADYTIRSLTQDAVLLIERTAGGPVHLVGHDWGGIVAWTVAATRPDLVRSLTIVNCPHPLVFRRALRNPIQLLRSWYMLAFQVPGMAEYLLEFRRGAFLALLLKHLAHYDRPTIAYHRQIWQYPGAIQRPLYWYRALRRTLQQADEFGDLRVHVPTQIVWGRRDPAFRPQQARASASHCDHARVEYLKAGHWPQSQQPERVSELLAGWFARHP